MESQSEIVSIQLDNGTIVKVRAPVVGGYEDVVSLDALLPFENVTNTIEAIAGAMTKTLDKIKPDKASVEFGIEVGIDSGTLTTLLAKATGSGNLKITLEWEKAKSAKTS